MTDIGISRKQKVFAVLETTRGTLEFPTWQDVVLPAGNAVMNQTPDFTDSEEIKDSLDVLDQFQNAMPPGTFEIPTYLRPSGTLGSLPQGDALFQSMQGARNAATTASLSANISATEGTINFDTLAGGTLPEKGVITIGSETIQYGALTMTTTTSGVLTSLSRGYNSTTAAIAATNEAITLNSVYYKQQTTSPSLTVWIETDHFVQGMAGCAVSQVVLGVNNTGAASLKFSGNGMQMVFAGKSAVTGGTAASGATHFTSTAPKNYKPGARLYNYTKSDNNSNAGFEIVAVNITTGDIEVTPAITMDWENDDVIKGFLPTYDAIGSAIESRYTSITIDGVVAKFKSTEFNFSVPKRFIDDEVGVTYPEDFVEDKREITSNFNVYFRAVDAKYFTDGYNANEVVMSIVFGNTVGSQMRLHMKKTRLQVPEISFNAPTVELSMGLKALGTSGEDSCQIMFE
jgi:hypothetical protein